ncbi:MAG: DUF4389 domain-containing protein [Gammaproteobacteria bacterium]|nr:DUF4389 domain-containing protein [Gammaproteobacteria bacterium]
MNDQTTEIKSNNNPWERGLYMLLFVFIYSVAEFVLGALVLIHFILVLIHGKPDQRLKEFGSDLSRFIYQVFLFLTYNTEERPFPFKPWVTTKNNLDDDLP